MKHSLFAAALAGFALASASVEAGAQMGTIMKPVQFGVSAGVAIPLGDFGKGANMGFTGGAQVGFSPAMIPLGIRVDGAYNQWGAKQGGGTAHITSVTGNLVYKIPSMAVAPYLIGGAGWYNLGASGGVPSENDFGWNAGGGISLPLSGFNTFLEARYHRVTLKGGGSTAFVPITFGVMF